MSRCYSQTSKCGRTSNMEMCLAPLSSNYVDLLANENISSDPKKMNALRAAYVKDTIWRTPTIKMAFSRTKKERLTTVYTKENGAMTSNADPLSVEITNLFVANKISQEEAVKRIILERFQPLMDTTLEFVPNERYPNERDANFVIEFVNDRSAYVNDLGRRATVMHFGWFDGATFMHEFLHALGAIHEHQNPVGGTQIKFNEKDVLSYIKCTQGWPESAIRHNILEQYNVTTLNGSNFDPLSIMMYGFPDCLTYNDVGTQRNERLSAYDMLWVAENYSQNKSAEELFNKIYAPDSFAANKAKSDEMRARFNNCRENVDCNPKGGNAAMCSNGVCVPTGTAVNPTQPVVRPPTQPPVRPPTIPPTIPPTEPPAFGQQQILCCSSDSQCEKGMICVNNTCVYPSRCCASDADCGTKMSCVNNSCRLNAPPLANINLDFNENIPSYTSPPSIAEQEMVAQQNLLNAIYTQPPGSCAKENFIFGCNKSEEGEGSCLLPILLIFSIIMLAIFLISQNKKCGKW
jgi:hypothetical protein